MLYTILSFIFGAIIGLQIDILPLEIRQILLASSPFALLILILFPRFYLLTALISFLFGIAAHAPAATPGTKLFQFAAGSCETCYAPSLLTDKNKVYLSSGKNFDLMPFTSGKVFSDSLLANSKHKLPSRYFTFERINFFDRLGQTLNRMISDVIEERPTPIQEWYRSLILGEQPNLSHTVKRAFIETGLYHILAISGLHLSISALILTALGKFIFLIFLRFKLTSSMKIILQIFMNAVIVFILLVYSYCVHFPPSVQRSFLLVAVDLAVRSGFGSLPLVRRMQIAALLQILLFPVGFLNIGNILSWLAYLIVVENPQTRSLLGSIKQQIKLTLCCLALTGQLSFGGILLNLIVVPLFTPIFCLMVGDIFLGYFQLNWLANLAFSINQTFLVVVLKSHDFVSNYFALFDFTNLPAMTIRMAAYAAMFVMVLRNSQFHSITKIGLFKGAP